LPERYKGFLTKDVRVIILIDEEKALQPQKIAKSQRVRKLSLKAAKIKTKKLKYTREEANVR
jgi:hypothetical protein